LSAHRLIAASAFDALLREAARFLREAAAHGEVLVAGHTRGAAEDLARSACDTALIGVHVTGVRELAGVLARPGLVERGVAMASSLAREAMAARVVAESRPLTYYEPVAGLPGFAKALSRTIDELRLNRIAPEQLPADLARLLHTYGRRMEEAKLADPADVYSAATGALRGGTAAICRLPLILITPLASSRAERAFLEVLYSQSPRALVAAPAAEIDRYAWLEIEAELLDEPAGNAVRSLQQALFSSDIRAGHEDTSVEFFSAAGEALECVEIARRTGVVGFDETAILLRDPVRYVPLVEEALRRARIPAWFARGLERPDPAGRAFLALLNCAAEGLNAARFAEYLSLRQAPVTSSPAVWERLLAEAAIYGGRDRWTRRLAGLRHEYEVRLKAAGDEDAERYCREQIAEVEALSDFALPMIEQLDNLTTDRTWGEWIDALQDLAVAALEEPDAVGELLLELAPMRDLGPAGLEAVLRVLGERLGTARRRAEGDRYGAVFVGSIEDARGMSFRHVFIPGLVEGGFPKIAREDPLLLDSARLAISRDLATSADDRERMLLRTAAAAARERVVFSYPRIEPLTGRERVPSLYAYDAMRAARGAPFRPQQLQEQAKAAAETSLAWPAPQTPESAIDDAEFDLAMLRPLLDAGPPGSASYLTRVNPHLLDALRARGRRWRAPWRSWDGVVDLDMESLEILQAHRLTARAYSPSALQQFAVCPYRFALRAIYGFRPAEHPAPLARMNPAVRGEIAHRIQFELLRILKAQRLLPVTGATLEQAQAELNKVIARVSAEYAERLAPAIPRMWQSEIETIRVDLRGWLAEIAQASPDWTPVACELSFGMEAGERHDTHSTRDPVRCADGVLLRGSIDLVERHASGMLRVTDHKTGRVPATAPQCVGGGEVLQPLLYALAAEWLLDQPVATTRLFYSTLRANYREITIAAHEPNRRRLAQVLKTIDAAIYQGFLPAAPREDACRLCDYRSVCGPYEEERAGRKAQEELRPLKEVRNWL
jgi:RecB family exonuclease